MQQSMQTEKQLSDISTIFEVLILNTENYSLWVSQKLQSKRLEGIHKLLRFF